MAVQTRLDARSKRNNSVLIYDKNGALLCSIEAVSNKDAEGDIGKLANEVNLRITTSDDVQIVKSNGVVLRKK